LQFITRFSQAPARYKYFAAIALTLAVIAARLSLDPWWGLHQNRHLVFLPTVMLSAYLGGYGPGILSAALCTLAIDYFWTEPRYLWWHPSFELFLFFIIAVATCKLIDSLHTARARAEAARVSREQVLTIVAHDLRNPLTTIKMSVTLLRRRQQGADELARRLEAIERAVTRSDNLIRDLLDASRAERGELEVAIRDEAVRSVLHDVREFFTAVARERRIVFEVIYEGSGSIRCDRDRLLQVLGNLIGNALKFTPEGGLITLRVEEGDRDVRFEVADTGPGIKPEDLPHIFDRYWYTDRRGTGLGLFIAQSILISHGSRLDVRSEPGRGARFFFTLPLAPAARGADSVRSSSALS
jgi:signal transduction histidine kinase